MIAITGGGTGGHLVIARAIKEELNRRGIKPIYIGSTNGQDRSWFENDDGFEKTYFIDSQGVVNKKGFKKVYALFAILKSALLCKKLFKEHHIDAVFSVGGYSAAPAALATILFRKSLFIHEQNAITGKLNHLLKPFCSAFFSSYNQRGSIYTSYPISQQFFSLQKERNELRTIIFLGGSQGASYINHLAKEMAPHLVEANIKIIHQTGSKEYQDLKLFYEENEINADVFDFSKDIPLKLSQSDFAISRAGASTLWELSASGIPALFIPLPHAANNHQFYNAQMLVNNNLALILQQHETFTAKEILENIKTFDIKRASGELMKLIQAKGARDIVDSILKHCKRGYND